MKIGLCADLLKAPLAAAAGFDCIEGALSALAQADGAAFERMREAVRASGIEAETCNVMLPGTFRLTGPDADLSPVREYLKRGFERARALGARVQVFGSGAARQVPEGWPMERALEQLAEFLVLSAGIAEAYGIDIVVEPLRPAECNIIHTVREALALADRVGLPEVGVLADWYHMSVQGEGTDGLEAAGSRLLHVHIANPAGRRYPLPGDGAEYDALFSALRRIGYDGRVSVEGSGSDEELAACARRMRECMQ